MYDNNTRSDVSIPKHIMCQELRTRRKAQPPVDDLDGSPALWLQKALQLRWPCQRWISYVWVAERCGAANGEDTDDSVWRLQRDIVSYIPQRVDLAHAGLILPAGGVHIQHIGMVLDALRFQWVQRPGEQAHSDPARGGSEMLIQKSSHELSHG